MTTRVEQDGVWIQLGAREGKGQIWYDLSGDLLIIQADDDNNALQDVVTLDGTAGISVKVGALTVDDDVLLGVGTGNTARLSWDTTDADANELLLQMPAGGAVDVPVLVVGQSVESVDLGLYNGVVDPRIALFGVGAVATAPVLEFRKARGTIASPTVVTTGDDLGTLDFYGCVAAGAYVRAASIRADMAGTIASTRGPGTLTFLTATDAAPSVLTAALTLNANQSATFGASIFLPSAAVIDFASGDVTITHATNKITVAGGTLNLAGNLVFDAALDIAMPAATAVALEITNGTSAMYSFDTRVTTAGVTTHTLRAINYTIASAADAVVTALNMPAHTLSYTGTTQVTSEVNTVALAGRSITGDTATLTVDQANTLKLMAPTEGTNILLTATVALRIAPAAGTPTNQYGIYVDALTGGTSKNRAIYLAGANSIEFGAADDIIILAATAAALEISDGTTKFYAFDTRVAVAGVTSHALDVSDYTVASGATNVVTGLSLAAHTLNYTGSTQVTTQIDTVVLGARTIAGDTATLTVNEANTLLLVAPTEGTNVAITAAAALRIIDAGGTPVNQYGIFIETLTAGATADYAIWVAGANAVHMGTAGTATGQIEIAGATSGTVTVTVGATAGTWTFTFPATAGEAGDVLVTDGAGVASWVSGVRSVDVQLTNAQVLALRGTPITLVAAPGANRAIIVHRVYFVLDAAAGAYTESVDNLVVEYSGGTDVTGAIETTGWVDAAAVGVRSYGAAITELTPVANEAVRLFNTGDGEFGGGNAANTLSVRVWYSVVDTVAFS